MKKKKRDNILATKQVTRFHLAKSQLSICKCLENYTHRKFKINLEQLLETLIKKNNLFKLFFFKFIPHFNQITKRVYYCIVLYQD